MTSTTNNDDAAATPPQDAAAAATSAAGHPAQPGMVAFAGTGPGGPELLTVRAAYLIGRADLVAGRPEVIDSVRDLIPAGAEIRDLADLDAEPEMLAAAARAGRLAVALYGGDPLLFGPAAGHVAACARAGARFEVVPGVPAATAVPAYAGIPLTSEAAGDVRIVHATDVSRVSGDGPPPRSLVILGAEAGPPDLAKMLTAAGWPDSTPFTITWNGATTDQLTVTCALGSVTADLKAAGVNLLTETGPAVAVVGEAAAAHRSCPGTRPSRCSAGGSWCRGPRSRPGRSRSGCGRTARCRRRCRPSRWSRRGPRSRWSGRSGAWSPGATSGSRSPR